MERPAPTTVLDGRYRLLRVLPAEPTVERYLGVAAVMPSRAVLIKRVPESLARNRPTVGRFLDEARITARLHHPAIPAVLDVGEDAGTYVAVFDHLPGLDAAALLEGLAQTKTLLPAPLAVRLATVVLEALSHAHAAKDSHGEPMELVHRDVSAVNVRVGYDGQVQLGGFGLARQKEQSAHTSVGVIRGQLASVAPEQLVPGEIDARVDLWAVGVLLHELLTGVRPFERTSEFHTLKAIREEQPPPPSSLRPELPQALDTFLARALAKDRADRFQSAAQMQQALQACVAPADAAALAAFVTSHLAEQLGPHRAAARAGNADLKTVLMLAGGQPVAGADSLEPDDEPSETGRVELPPVSTEPARSRLAISDPSQPSLTPSVITDPTPRAPAPMPEAPPRAASLGVRPPSKPAVAAARPPSRPELPRAPRKRRFRLVSERGIHPAIHPLVAVVAILLALAGVRHARAREVLLLTPLVPTAQQQAPLPAPNPQPQPQPQALATPAEPVDAGAGPALPPDVSLSSDPTLHGESSSRANDRHKGQLRVDAPRRTRLLVDGHAVSSPVSLAPGAHRLRVLLPGGAVHEETVHIEAGRTLRRAFSDKVVPPQPHSHWP